MPVLNQPRPEYVLADALYDKPLGLGGLRKLFDLGLNFRSGASGRLAGSWSTRSNTRLKPEARDTWSRDRDDNQVWLLDNAGMIERKIPWAHRSDPARWMVPGTVVEPKAARPSR